MLDELRHSTFGDSEEAPPGVPTTVDTSRCKFPFMYKKTEHWGCTTQVCTRACQNVEFDLQQTVLSRPKARMAACVMFTCANQASKNLRPWCMTRENGRVGTLPWAYCAEECQSVERYVVVEDCHT